MMKLSLATVASASVVLSLAGTSRADDTTTTTTQQAQTPAPAAAQPAPVVVQQAPPATVAQPAPPVATTTTTAAPYTAAPYAAPTDQYAESTTEHRPNKSLLSTGVGMFVISYGASVIAGAVSPLDADKNLFVPVAGPWMDYGQRNDVSSNESLNKAMLITSGIVQGAGVLLALGSLVIPESTSTTSKSHTAKAEVHVLPVSYGAGAGLGAIGTF